MPFRLLRVVSQLAIGENNDMKRSTSLLAALALATTACLLMLGMTWCVDAVLSFLNALPKGDCASCESSDLTIVLRIIDGIGVLLAVLAFWGVLQGLRPRSASPKQKV
jgi:hypothetical protein